MSTAELNEAMRKGELDHVKSLRSQGVQYDNKSLDESVNGRLQVDPFSREGLIILMNNRTDCWVFAMGDGAPYTSDQAIPIVAVNYLKIDWTMQFWKDFYYANTEALSKYPAAFSWIQVQLGLRTFVEVPKNETLKLSARVEKNQETKETISLQPTKLNKLSNINFDNLPAFVNPTKQIKPQNVKIAPNKDVLRSLQAQQPNFINKHFKRQNIKDLIQK